MIYIEYIKGFLSRKSYMIPLLLTAAVSYAVHVTELAVGCDDLLLDVHDNGEMLAQGRFVLDIINFFLASGNAQRAYFLQRFFAVIFMMLASVMFSALFKEASKDKINPVCYTLFSCLFVSYPLIAEIFVYSGSDSGTAYTFCFVAAAIMLWNVFLESRKWWACALSCFLLLLTTWTSLPAAYVCAVFAVLILRGLYDDDSDERLLQVIKKGLSYVIPIAAAVITMVIVNKIIFEAFDIERSHYSNNSVMWLEGEASIYAKFKTLVYDVIVRFFVMGIWYFPIAVFAFCAVAAAIAGIVLAVKHRRLSYLLLFAGLVFSCLVLSFIQGEISNYRMCQTFSLFTAFVIMLIVSRVLMIKMKKFFKGAVIYLSFLLVFLQANSLCNLFSLELQRWHEERQILLNIADDLGSEFDLSEPVVFVYKKDGEYKLSDHILKEISVSNSDGRYKKLKWLIDRSSLVTRDDGKYAFRFTETVVYPYIYYCNCALETNLSDEFQFLYMRAFRYLGYELKCANAEMYDRAMKEAEEMPAYPRDGYIRNTNGYNIVVLW